MKQSILCLLSAIAILSCAESASQKDKAMKNSGNRVGGACEDCEAIYASLTPFANLNWIDTLPDFTEAGPKLVISGTIYKADGKTPAKNVVLYVYHTDQTGHYTNRNHEEGAAGKNGYAKGWMKTNDQGQYQFYTLRPQPYPQRSVPAHIHPLIKEPDKNEYWIDEYLFDDDSLLTTSERAKLEGRGGSGIIRLQERDGIWYGKRDIVLGKNVPDYPNVK